MTFAGIALGCGNFGGVGSAPELFGRGIAEDEAFAIMDRAWDAGITWFDTADAYGGGRSEAASTEAFFTKRCGLPISSIDVVLRAGFRISRIGLDLAFQNRAIQSQDPSLLF